jgi:hypothetical protein
MKMSQESWVKTFMQDVMDEKGQVLFDNLAWFEKKLCSVMTSASACEHMWSIEGWIHNKRRIKLVQPNVERGVRVLGNLVLRKVILLSKEQKVASDSLRLVAAFSGATDIFHGRLMLRSFSVFEVY